LITQDKIFEELIQKDNKLKKILDPSKNCPFLLDPVITNEILFYELAQSIVGQQISAKAADTIWKRLVSGSQNKKSFLVYISNTKLEWARIQGLSQRKHEYIKSIAENIISNKLSLESVVNLKNNEAKKYLESQRGVGPWTSEMFLMFAYKRLDIFSIGDIALKRAVSEIYNIDRSDDKSIIAISETWKPYRSIVCWYLWEYLGV
tara:strand:- start:3 stop:617 length:615 start_codon:yes stop_codon:yes gene_type:complete